MGGGAVFKTRAMICNGVGEFWKFLLKVSLHVKYILSSDYEIRQPELLKRSLILFLPTCIVKFSVIK